MRKTLTNVIERPEGDAGATVVAWITLTGVVLFLAVYPEVASCASASFI